MAKKHSRTVNKAIPQHGNSARAQKPDTTKKNMLRNFPITTVQLDIINFFYPPTDTQIKTHRCVVM
jgi:hypothetical protein